MIASSFARAEWFTLYSADCNLTNGHLTYSSIDNRADDLTITYGFIVKNFQTNSKVFTTNTKKDDKTETPVWWFNDSFAKYTLKLNFDYNKVKKETTLTNVPATVTQFVPVPAPVWYPTGYEMTVGSGTCTLKIGPFVY
jgi:hypothetical protein